MKAPRTLIAISILSSSIAFGDSSAEKPAPAAVVAPAAATASFEPAQASEAPTPTPVIDTPQIDARYVRHGNIGLVEVHAESDALFGDAVWAIDRFRTHGLPIPSVEVFVSADQSECKASAGYLTFLQDGSMRIRSCGSRFTLLHELAHAWDIATLSDERRQAFMKLRELDSWHSDVWAEAAGEHAANAIAWGLGDRPLNTRLMPNDVDSMREAFVMLTGSRPHWEPRLDTSDHGVALDARKFIGRTDLDDDTQEPAAQTPTTDRPPRSTPDFAPHLIPDPSVVQQLTKSDLRAVAGTTGRMGFLNEEAAFSFNAMKTEARRDGIVLNFASAWRSWKLQDRAHRHFLETGTNLANNPVPNVAHPDKSNHPKGLALDFVLKPGVHEWLSDNAHRFGWYPISSEDWHWEYRGGPDRLLAGMNPPKPLPLPTDDAMAALPSELA